MFGSRSSSIARVVVISSPSQAMSRQRDEWISKRLTCILRYEMTSQGLVADTKDFVTFSAVLRLFDQRQSSHVYRAAVNSRGSYGSRFEFCQDERRGCLIRVKHQGGGKGRKGKGDSTTSLNKQVSQEHPADTQEVVHINDPSDLLAFLNAAFFWLSGHVQAPDTESLQSFIVNWKQVETRTPCASDDPQRKQCLALIADQIESFQAALQSMSTNETVNFLAGIGSAENPWYNFTLPEFLATWELENYQSSWEMSWSQIEYLFESGQVYE